MKGQRRGWEVLRHCLGLETVSMRIFVVLVLRSDVLVLVLVLRKMFRVVNLSYKSHHCVTDQC